MLRSVNHDLPTSRCRPDVVDRDVIKREPWAKFVANSAGDFDELGGSPIQDRMGHPEGARARGRVRAVALLQPLLLLLLVLACAPERAPELLQIDEVSPTALERGARLELGGSGFPDRRRGRVTFSGTLHRPGEAPRQVKLGFDATAESSSLLALPVTSELLHRFLDDAPHGTFRGRVAVVFPSLHPGAPALSGSIDGAVLDWFGPMARRRDAEDDLRAEAERFLAFVGFDVDESLVVTQVHPDSEAERSGLEVGQRLVALDGVRLDGRADLVPRDDGWQSRVIARGADGDELSLAWDRGAFRAAALDDLPRAFVWIGGALALLLASAGSRARGWAWVEARLSSQKEAAHKGESRRGLLGVWRRLLAACHPGGVSKHLPAGLRLAPFVVFFLVFTLWSAIALGHPRVLGWLDFPALLLAALVSVLLAALILGGQPEEGARRQRGFRLREGLKEVLGTLLAWSPIPLAALGIVYEVGSLDLADLVAGQGALPSRWRVFAAPWHMISLALLVAACVPEGGPRRSPLSVAPPLGISGGIARLLEWFAVTLVCGLGAALFLGGWSAPSLDGVQSAVVGPALFLIKTWLLLQGVLWWRGVLGELRRSEVLASWAGRGVPLAGAACALQISSASAGWQSSHGQELSLAALTTAALVGGFFLLRATRALLRPSPHVAINPWL